MGTNYVDPDYRTKYKHLFRDRTPTRSLMNSLTDDMNKVIKEFNSSTNHIFYAENRILIPGENGEFPRHGVIIEHHGSKEDFDTDFSNYIKQIETLAKKLDSITTIYEYSFKTEFCKKDRWVEYEGHYVAYNLSL